MKTRKLTIMFLSAIMVSCFFTANAQDNAKKWTATQGTSLHIDFIQQNQGWKPASGARPGGLGIGFGLNIGARYDKLFVVAAVDFSVSGNSLSGKNTCDMLGLACGLQLGYDLCDWKSGTDKEKLSFVTGLMFANNILNYEFDGGSTSVTATGARNYSAGFSQGSLYVPLELRLHVSKAYIGLSYMLNVYHGDVYTGNNAKTKVIDVPDINYLPLRLTFGVQF